MKLAMVFPGQGSQSVGMLQVYAGLPHVDETRAVEPLERTARWDEGEVPETFPYAV